MPTAIPSGQCRSWKCKEENIALVGLPDEGGGGGAPVGRLAEGDFGQHWEARLITAPLEGGAAGSGRLSNEGLILTLGSTGVAMKTAMSHGESKANNLLGLEDGLLYFVSNQKTTYTN